jgi:hypothetical protein
MQVFGCAAPTFPTFVFWMLRALMVQRLLPKKFACALLLSLTVFQAQGERGPYESRVCLFSLSISDVLIFNVHENLMNLYQASGQVLLKTIFRGYCSLALRLYLLMNSLN